MPRRPSAQRKYPYAIPQFLNYEEVLSPHPSPIAVNEYFNIEALLRTDKAMDAYLKSGVDGLRQLFHENKIRKQEPLTRSHHILLINPPLVKVDPEFEDVYAKLGYISIPLNIRDLAIAAERPKRFKIGSSEYTYSVAGQQEVFKALRQNHPQYVYLAIDVSKETFKIKRFIGELIDHKRSLFEALKAKHQAKDIFEMLRHYSKTPFDNIPAWLKYFECYDRRMFYDDLPLMEWA